MKKLIIASVLGLLPGLGMASGGAHLETANIDLRDQASLQRGAKTYIDNCMGCHRDYNKEFKPEKKAPVTCNDCHPKKS